jgi:hypothetical protein
LLARKARRAMLAPLVRRVMSVLQDRKVILVRLALRACKVTSVPQVLKVRREKLVLRALRGWCGVAHGASNRRTRSAMW